MSTNVSTDIDDRIEAALRNVREPNAGVDVLEAGLVEDATIDDGDVTVYLDLATVDGRTGQEIAEVVVRAVTEAEGIESVHVERARPGAGSDDRTTGTTTFDRIIAVASAKGGVGKSTIATHLAGELSERGEEVALFDADIHGPNVPELLDISGPIYSTDDGDPLPVGYGEMEVMSVGLMTDGAPLAWRGAMAHDTISELFDDTAWTNTGTLVVDLPPGTGDVVLTTLQEVPVDGAVVVTTPFHSAVADTSKTVELFRENDIPVIGAIVNMAGFTCENCDHDHDLFPGDSPAEELQVEPLAEVPFTTELQESPDSSVNAPLANMDDLVDAFEARYDEVWEIDVPEDAVDLRERAPDDRREIVADEFTAREPGEEFVVVSDRDPSPVRTYLADIDDVDPEAFEQFEVRKQNPETWLLRTVRPE